MYLTDKQAVDKNLIMKLAEQIISPVNSIQELRGKISFNYLINGKYIFKLPSHRTKTFLWEKQDRNLPCLQKQLKYQIPTPKVVPLNLSKRQILGYFYPQIEGNILTRANFCKLSLPQKISFFEKLSEAIKQLHEVNPKILPEMPPSYTDTLFSLLSDIQTDKGITLDHIKENFRQQNLLLSTTSLCHLDLHAENIVLDNRNNIVGILDWDNLSLGEPFMEFHTNLYKSSDLKFLRNIYQQKTQKAVNPEKFQYMDNFYKKMLGLIALGALTPPLTKWESKTTRSSSQNWKRAFHPDTDRWANFGHT